MKTLKYKLIYDIKPKDSCDVIVSCASDILSSQISSLYKDQPIQLNCIFLCHPRPHYKKSYNERPLIKVINESDSLCLKTVPPLIDHCTNAILALKKDLLEKDPFFSTPLMKYLEDATSAIYHDIIAVSRDFEDILHKICSTTRERLSAKNIFIYPGKITILEGGKHVCRNTKYLSKKGFDEIIYVNITESIILRAASIYRWNKSMLKDINERKKQKKEEKAKKLLAAKSSKNNSSLAIPIIENDSPVFPIEKSIDEES